MRTPTLRSIQRRWLKVPDGTIFTTVGPPALVTAASHAPTDIAWLFEIARCANNYVVARIDGEPDAEAYAALVRALGLAAPSDAAGDTLFERWRKVEQSLRWAVETGDYGGAATDALRILDGLAGEGGVP